MKAIPYTDERGNTTALILGDSINGWNLYSDVPKLIGNVKFELPELFAELINDSLIDGVRNGRWETEVTIQLQPPVILDWRSTMTLAAAKPPHDLNFEYYADGFSLAVLNNVLYVKHLANVEVDATADLITGEGKLVALIEWIQEGGQFPLLKQDEQWNPDT